MAAQPQRNSTQQATPATTAPTQTGTPLVDAAIDRIITYTPFQSDDPIRLSARQVIRYFCKPTAKGNKCTEDQAVRFLMLCKARRLNPWEGDAFLVGYDTQDGPEFNLITAHQAYLKRAEAHKAFDGMESGLVVHALGDQEEKQLLIQGDVIPKGYGIVGGWAKVYRRDRSKPTFRKIALTTFSTGRSRWAKDPAGMIVKCAEGDALRSAFPNNLPATSHDVEVDTPLREELGVEAESPITNSILPNVSAPRGETGDPDQDPFVGADGEIPNELFGQGQDVTALRA